MERNDIKCHAHSLISSPVDIRVVYHSTSECEEGPLTCCKRRWFTHIWEQLDNMNGSTQIKDQWNPVPQREGDQPLMESFADTSTIIKAMINKANWCQMYAQTVTIEDLAHENGKFIPWSRMEGKWWAVSNLEWLNFKCPPASYWYASRQCDQRAFTTRPMPGRWMTRQDHPFGQQTWKVEISPPP